MLWSLRWGPNLLPQPWQAAQRKAACMLTRVILQVTCRFILSKMGVTPPPWFPPCRAARRLHVHQNKLLLMYVTSKLFISCITAPTLVSSMLSCTSVAARAPWNALRGSLTPSTCCTMSLVISTCEV